MPSAGAMARLNRRTASVAALAIVGIAVLVAYLARVAMIRHEQALFDEYLASPTINLAEAKIDIAPGENMNQVSESLQRIGVIEDATKFASAAVRLGQDRKVKAGQYLIPPGKSHVALIGRLADGDVILERFAIIEGTKFSTVLENLSKSEHIDSTLDGLTPEEAWKVISPSSEFHPEGMFYPDTYLHGHGEQDIALLRSSHQRLMEFLEAEWEMRQDGLALNSPYEALILASMIEKETGSDGERGLVSSAFHNRLRIGMMLQSDPTVIYGLGDGFDGNLTRAHLETPTPYNTYTMGGLPPTPIAIASKESILAALNPPKSDYLYFVADGSGGHHFSKSLREHNNAVNRYQRRRK